MTCLFHNILQSQWHSRCYYYERCSCWRHLCHWRLLLMPLTLRSPPAAGSSVVTKWIIITPQTDLYYTAHLSFLWLSSCLWLCAPGSGRLWVGLFACIYKYRGQTCAFLGKKKNEFSTALTLLLCVHLHSSDIGFIKKKKKGTSCSFYCSTKHPLL